MEFTWMPFKRAETQRRIPVDGGYRRDDEAKNEVQQ
jgi:hypothetical protein